MAFNIKNASLAFCLQLFTPSASAQQQNDSLSLIVNEIELSNIYEVSYTVGYAGTVSKQYLRYRQILQLASISDLSELAVKHPNAVVRLYAYQALKQKQTAIPAAIANYFANDSTVLKTLNGCFAGTQKVSVLANQNLLFTGTSVEIRVKQ